MKWLVVVVASLLCSSASARDDAWSFDWSFGYKVSTARVISAECHKVVPLHWVGSYAADPRPGFTYSCGGSNPVYYHFLGRRVAQPLPKVRLELGWAHMSHAWDNTESRYDAIAVRGRFTW